MISRRQLLYGLATFGTGAVGFGGYAFAIEPYRLKVARYNLTPRNWPKGLKLKIAAIADPHICDPWMSLGRVEEIVAATNALKPDLIVMLGDFVGGHRLVHRLGRAIPHAEWAPLLARLEAPLGRYAVQGNHDWWEFSDVQKRHSGPTRVQVSLESVGIPVFENDVIRLEKDGHAFWLAGLGDQWAFYDAPDGSPRPSKFDYYGVDDLPGTMAKITDDAPVIMMIHEPDIFPEIPDQVALTLAGHTHGGQVQFFGYAPIVPSRYGERYVYGHIVERGRHLIVSGGLGCSGLPVRFGRPPEIVEVRLGDDQGAYGDGVA